MGWSVVARNADGWLEVFARGTDHAVHRIVQFGHCWTDWTCLGDGVVGNFAVGINFDQRLELFVRGTDNALWHRWQMQSGSSWN